MSQDRGQSRKDSRPKCEPYTVISTAGWCVDRTAVGARKGLVLELSGVSKVGCYPVHPLNFDGNCCAHNPFCYSNTPFFYIYTPYYRIGIFILKISRSMRRSKRTKE